MIYCHWWLAAKSAHSAGQQPGSASSGGDGCALTHSTVQAGPGHPTPNLRLLASGSARQHLSSHAPASPAAQQAQKLKKIPSGSPARLRAGPTPPALTTRCTQSACTSEHHKASVQELCCLPPEAQLPCTSKQLESSLTLAAAPCAPAGPTPVPWPCRRPRPEPTCRPTAAGTRTAAQPPVHRVGGQEGGSGRAGRQMYARYVVYTHLRAAG